MTDQSLMELSPPDHPVPRRRSRWKMRHRRATLLFARMISPRAFFAGVAVMFICCCVTGKQIVSHNIFKNFVRFHQQINPEFLYYPTALQVRRLAEEKLPADKICVVIGGDSVFNGVGQRPDHVWSERLAKLLGDEYRVLNVANRSAMPQEHGMAVMSLLHRTRPRLIYLTDCLLPAVSRIEGTPAYLSFDLDAASRGYLYPWPDRDKLIATYAAAYSKEFPAYLDTHIAALANKALYFNDLWSTVGYRWCFTAVDPVNIEYYPFWRARRLIHDPEESATPWPPQYPAQDNERLLKRLESYRSINERSSSNSWAANFRDFCAGAFPAPLRRQILVSVLDYSPYYLDQCTDKTRQEVNATMDFIIATLHESGIRAERMPRTLAVNDYHDFLHLTESGGEKLAQQSAVRIRELARDLGYISEARR